MKSWADVHYNAKKQAARDKPVNTEKMKQTVLVFDENVITYALAFSADFMDADAQGTESMQEPESAELESQDPQAESPAEQMHVDGDLTDATNSSSLDVQAQKREKERLKKQRQRERALQADAHASKRARSASDRAAYERKCIKEGNPPPKRYRHW